MKKFSSIQEAQRDYEHKEEEKVVIEKPQHVEKYDENQKRDVQRSKKNHQAAT